MSHPIVLSTDAVLDIDSAVDYYNSRSYGLGFEFADTLDNYFQKISQLPTASAIRYDNIRVKPAGCEKWLEEFGQKESPQI